MHEVQRVEDAISILGKEESVSLGTSWPTIHFSQRGNSRGSPCPTLLHDMQPLVFAHVLLGCWVLLFMVTPFPDLVSNFLFI